MTKKEADKLKKENPYFMDIAKGHHSLEVALFSIGVPEITRHHIQKIERAITTLKRMGVEDRKLIEFWRTL